MVRNSAWVSWSALAAHRSIALAQLSGPFAWSLVYVSLLFLAKAESPYGRATTLLAAAPIPRLPLCLRHIARRAAGPRP